MPIQAGTQWTEYLNCPVCEHGFDIRVRQPISLGCGHTICKTCLFNLQRKQCPFDLGVITVEVERLPINTALMLLIMEGSSRSGALAEMESFRNSSDEQVLSLMKIMESLALFLKPPSSSLSRSMQRKLITLINCQLMEDEGRLRAARAARSLGERTVTELILHHQNPQQLSANLWAAVRGRGCQFLGPAMQEEVLALVLLALEDGEALSRKVLVMYVVQRLESQFPQASKTSIGHVVQLLYRASCFKVTKREGDSSLMQLKEEFRTYESLRREHDMQIVQIATEAGLRIAPDQWSSLLYGDTHHKSQMQSIMDKLQTPESFAQSVQELVIALQKTGDPGKLAELRPSLDFLAGIDPAQDTFILSFDTLSMALMSVNKVLSGLVAFVSLHSSSKRGGGLMNAAGSISSCSNNSGNNSNSNSSSTVGGGGSSSTTTGVAMAGGSNANNATGTTPHLNNSRYKTNLCRDLSIYGFCPRGKNCTFAHSLVELEQHRSHRKNSKGRLSEPNQSGGTPPVVVNPSTPTITPSASSKAVEGGPFRGRVGPPAPVAQVAPLPRARKQSRPQQQQQQQSNPTVQFHIYSDPAFGGSSVPFNPPDGQGALVNPSVIQYTTGVPAPSPSTFHHPFLDGGERGGISKEFLVSEEALFKGKKSLCEQSGDAVAPANDIIKMKNKSKQLEEEIVSKSIARIATKSLSALQSRKEEIIDTLEDLMGKDEASKLSQEFEELSFQKKANEGSGLEAQINSSTNPNNPSGKELMGDPSPNSTYSMWTTKSIVSLATKHCAEAAAAVAHEQAIHDGLLENRACHERDERPGIWSIFHQGVSFGVEDDIYPLPDVPLVSRFGPISRRCNTMLKPSVPSQATASMDDDTVPTDVVTNAKQMTHQIPSMTSPWFYQNGIMSVQPVAVGPNGEVGYILLADQPAPPPLPPPLLLQNPIRPVISLSETSPKATSSDDVETSESLPKPFDPSSGGGVNQIRQDQLSNELFLIESSIRDREQEISINHMQERSIPHHRGALDYGSYISQGLISTEEEEEEDFGNPQGFPSSSYHPHLTTSTSAGGEQFHYAA